MRDEKRFDCVEMRREIQHRIAAEYAGLSAAEVHRRRRQRITQNELLACVWAEARRVQVENPATR